jgi:NAD(P)-dependent dehydrogenase (short-subunit alcohol dehydrogenase family)
MEGEPPMFDVKNKVILVTGGSRGIGVECVKSLLDAGGAVVLHYNTRREPAEALAATAPDRCHVVGADLAQADAPRALWQAAVDWRGRVDVLVNNAAVYEPEPEEDDPEAWRASWWRTLQINLVAPAELARRAINHYRERGDGGILIHISSRGGHRGEKPLFGAYAASKAGLNAMSHTLARAHGMEGVFSYSIAPGWVGTDMAWDYIEQTGDRTPLEETALGSFAPPQEVANIVTFLASGAATHATGTVIDINGASFPR